MKVNTLLLFLLCLLFFSIKAQATHIVGGEFELLHIQGNRYKLNLILYSDVKNMDPRNPIDPIAEVHIRSKATNSHIESIVLYMVDQRLIPYTNPKCVIPQLETSKTVYSAEITLDPKKYHNEAGYYVNYERCCRNGVINNIERPGEVGQAFYLEFPPVVKDGEPFINSSPHLFPPLSDFARLGYPFFFDFSGTDADGDQLVYSLTTPLAGSSSPAQGNIVPPSRPAPYDPVDWAPRFSVRNMVPGNPSLQITDGGLIKVTPTQTGLFVFAVKVEEFRAGKKIGEVRREFQMLVYDYQGSDYRPVLSAQKKGDQQVFYKEITLNEEDFPDFDNDRCVTLQVRDDDVDAAKASHNGREPLSFKIKPVNFKMVNPDAILSATSGYVDKENRVFSLDLCLPNCPPTKSGPYVFDVVAYDDACAVPLTDTLRVTVNPAKARKNRPPQTQTSLSSSNTINIEKLLGEQITFGVSGIDPDNDLINLRAEGDGFSLSDYGMEFTAQTGTGSVNTSFSWKPECSNVNLPVKNTFTVFFITEDEAYCAPPNPDTVAVNIMLNLPPNAAPTLSFSGTESLVVEASVDSELVFQLLGTDPDQADRLSLKLDSVSSDREDIPLAYSWQDVEGAGKVNSSLVLTPDCSIFSNGARERSFTFYFSLQDDPCFTSITDTLSLKVLFRERELSFDDVKLINVFTPNGDNKNEYFEIANLPEDACYNKLEHIIVYNRWGKILYDTTNRNFRWDGEDYPAGTYFYQIKYTDFTYKSSLTIIRGDKPASPHNQ